MKTLALLSLLLAPILGTQQKPAAPPAAGSSAELGTVLTEMDKRAATFKSAQADFEWDNYQKVMDETYKQTGRVYFRRNGTDVEAMFDIIEPHAKQVLFKGGKLFLYDKKTDQLTEHKTQNKADVEAFLSLGFGAPGQDLPKNYDVKMDGWETADGMRVAKLELVSKSEKVRNMFTKFILWIDPQRDVPLKQQVLEPGDDYWLSHYTNFKLDGKIPDDIFRIKTTSHTRVVTVDQ
ncbi:MAG TPA: outer membrane lipoprotein carrier protein LolA [Candidatus Angelobacter sp.]